MICVLYHVIHCVCSAVDMTAETVAATPRYAPEDPTLPKPWKGLVDGTSGYLYFWNPETNVTQYERPTPVLDSAIKPNSYVPRHEFVSGKESSRFESYDSGVIAKNNEVCSNQL